MNINRYDLNLLKTFHALLNEGSTIKASEKLGLSQPAVSAALGRLRHVFNDPLFIRTGQRLEPTAVAVSLRPEIDQVMGALNGIFHQSDLFDPKQAQGNVWLSGSDFFSDLMMPRLLEEIRLEAPQLKIILVDQVFASSLEALERGQVDIAFWPDIRLPNWALSKRLLTTRFEMIARKGHPRLISAGIGDKDRIPLNLLCDLSHIHFSPDGKTLDDLDLILAKQVRERRIVATLPTFSGVVSVVRNSDLIGMLSSHQIDAFGDTRDFTRHPLPIDRPDISLAMLWNRRSEKSPVQAWVREKIARIFQEIDAVPTA